MSMGKRGRDKRKSKKGAKKSTKTQAQQAPAALPPPPTPAGTVEDFDVKQFGLGYQCMGCGQVKDGPRLDWKSAVHSDKGIFASVAEAEAAGVHGARINDSAWLCPDCNAVKEADLARAKGLDIDQRKQINTGIWDRWKVASDELKRNANRRTLALGLPAAGPDPDAPEGA